MKQFLKQKGFANAHIEDEPGYYLCKRQKRFRFKSFAVFKTTIGIPIADGLFSKYFNFDKRCLRSCESTDVKKEND